MKIIDVPTGKIIIIEGENGFLECLSIGDYGKEKNIKADFLGLSREIKGVPHGSIVPLEEKWVITISTQYGCSMNCAFCDVPKVGRGRNASVKDMVLEVMAGIQQFPKVRNTKRLNLHFARMGEPLLNINNIIAATFALQSMFYSYFDFKLHPVISTIAPKKMSDKKLLFALESWLHVKNALKGEAGLQLSINTTNEFIRYALMPECSSLYRLSEIIKKAIEKSGELKGRKITLNFALTDNAIDAGILKRLFNPKYFMCKITPMHETSACIQKGLITENGYTHYYPYKKVEENLKEAGFDVIVFIPSKEEDLSRITCGNAILADGGKNG